MGEGCPQDRKGAAQNEFSYFNRTVLRYKNKLVPHHDDLRIEMQIRTKLQHIWATAVETMGTFLGQALKSRQGDQQ